MAHGKRIEIRWRDVDAYLHVNSAVYPTYLEECRDEWVVRALGEVGDPWDFVLARDRENGRSRPRTDEERAAFERAGVSAA